MLHFIAKQDGVQKDLMIKMLIKMIIQMMIKILKVKKSWCTGEDELIDFKVWLEKSGKRVLLNLKGVGDQLVRILQNLFIIYIYIYLS